CAADDYRAARHRRRHYHDAGRHPTKRDRASTNRWHPRVLRARVARRVSDPRSQPTAPRVDHREPRADGDAAEGPVITQIDPLGGWMVLHVRVTSTPKGSVWIRLAAGSIRRQFFAKDSLNVMRRRSMTAGPGLVRARTVSVTSFAASSL